MALDVIVGLQRGDEGKGRFVDQAAVGYDVVARGNGGSNAGHTVVPEGLEPIALHQVPSGIAYPGKLNIIGNGVYLDARRLVAEIREVEVAGIVVDKNNLLISDIAHLVLPHHLVLDELRESGGKGQGSTKAGISYVARDKYLREGVRMEMVNYPKELLEITLEGLHKVYGDKKPKGVIEQIAQEYLAAIKALKPHIADTVDVVNDRLEQGQKVLAEGAQAYWLDINHGMYPAVTSSSTTTAGLLDGLGVAPKHLGKVTGVAKVVKSHVGGGPFVTEIHDEDLAATIRGPRGQTDSEYGATTKRPRRIGYPDLVELRNAIRTNGVDELVLSKMDHVSRFGPHMSVAVSYKLNGQLRNTAPSSALELAKCEPVYELFETWSGVEEVRQKQDLPQSAQAFVEKVETGLNVKVTKLGVGPGRNQFIGL